MTTYRDQLVKQYGLETGSVAGCGLDRLGRPCSADEVALAVRYFHDNQATLAKFPLGERRESVARHIDPRIRAGFVADRRSRLAGERSALET